MHSTRSPGRRAGEAAPPSLRTAPILPPPPSCAGAPASRAEAETMPPPPMSCTSVASGRSPSSLPPVSGVYGEEMPTLAPPPDGLPGEATPVSSSMVRTLRSPPPPAFDEPEHDTERFGDDDETPPPDTQRDPELPKG